MRGSVAIFILPRKLRLEMIGIDVKVFAVRDRGQYQGRNALPLLLGLEVCEVGRSCLGEQFLRQPLCLYFMTLYVGIGAGRDVFLDPCVGPPQEAITHDCPPIFCVEFGAPVAPHGSILPMIK